MAASGLAAAARWARVNRVSSSTTIVETVNPKPQTFNPKTLNQKPLAPDPVPETLDHLPQNFQPETPNPRPCNRNPRPFTPKLSATLNPEPQTARPFNPKSST